MNKDIQGLIQHPIYKKRLQHLEELEKNRVYCRHDLDHFLEVARIMCIVNIENQLLFPEHLLFGSALLHDMGRVEQYEQDISHDKASVAFAREILFSLKWSEKDIQMVCEAISSHSHRLDANERYDKKETLKTLGELLSFADHFSRKCYACQVQKECKWSQEEKVMKEYFNEDWK